MARKAPRPASAKPTPPETNAVPAAAPAGPSFDEIKDRAYAMWEAAGKPEGDDQRFWYEAELELRRAK